MTIAVATLHNYSYKELADYTFTKNLEPYCNLHGYKIICKNTDLPGDRSIYFEKIKIMRDAMEDSSIEWIWWLDCDAIVTNYHIKLDSIIDNQYDIIISSDWNGINCGSFLVKNSNRGKAWLDMIYSFRDVPRYKNHQWPEQAVMMETAHLYTDIMKVVPQKTLNSYYYSLYMPEEHLWRDRLNTNGNWTVGDFVIHFPGMPNITRMEYIKIFLQLSVLKPE